MKKFIVIGLGLAALLVVGVVVYVILNINPLVKSAINTFGPKLTKTDVSVQDVSLSIFSGAGSLSGLHIGNPEGFQQKSLMDLGKIDVALDLGSVTSDQIVIEKIALLSPHITYEQTGKSASNFEALMANIKEATGGSGDKSTQETTSTSDSGSKKTMLIKDFLLSDGQVNVAMTGLGGEAINIGLPTIHLTNIGGDQPVDQVIQQLMDAIYQAVQQSILSNGMAIYENGKKVASKALDFVEGAAGDAAKGVGDAVQGVGEGAGDAAKGTLDTVKDVGKSLF